LTQKVALHAGYYSPISRLTGRQQYRVLALLKEDADAWKSPRIRTNEGLNKAYDAFVRDDESVEVRTRRCKSVVQSALRPQPARQPRHPEIRLGRFK